jgi:hypothetical protein
MIARYSQYNQLHPAIELFLNRIDDMHYRYYASDLLKAYVHVQNSNIESSIRRVIAIMRLVGLPTHRHFRRIYRSDIHGITVDWRLSELACGLIILSFDETDHDTRQIQQRFLRYLGL